MSLRTKLHRLGTIRASRAGAAAEEATVSRAVKGRFAGALKCRAGFTLTEALATVIIVGLVTSILASGIALASRQYVQSMSVSEAQMLYSSLQKILDTELRFTSNFAADAYGNVTSFESKHYIAKGTAGSEGGLTPTKVLCTVPSGSNGSKATVPTEPGLLGMASGIGDNVVTNLFLGEGVYNYGLEASVTRFIFNEDTGFFELTLIISKGSDDDKQVFAEGSFTVRALNAYHEPTEPTLPPDEDKDDEEKKEDNSNFIVPNDGTTQFEAPVVKWENMQKNGAAVGSIILSENGSVYYVANNAIPANKTDLTIDGDGNSSDLLTVKMGADNKPLVVHADQVDDKNYQFEQGTLCISNGTLYIATKKTNNPPKKDDGNWQVLSSAESKPIATSSSS